MTHLGADVAAFVDGQLDDRAMAAARTHVAECDLCATAVRQQHALKARIRTVQTPELPPQLLAALTGLPQARIVKESVWARVCRSRPARCGAALLGASLAVVMVAYGVGGIREQIGDQVTPPTDRYAADFHDSGVTQTLNVRSSDQGSAAALTVQALARLRAAGWPCHETLADGFARVGATWLDQGQVLALSYANGFRKLNVFEQNGALDADGLHGFDRRTVSRAQVWVRDGIPTIVTWGHEGVVYTIVTDAGRAQIARTVAQLPTDDRDRGGTVERIGSGFARMATWLSAAA